MKVKEIFELFVEDGNNCLDVYYDDGKDFICENEHVYSTDRCSSKKFTEADRIRVGEMEVKKLTSQGGESGDGEWSAFIILVERPK